MKVVIADTGAIISLIHIGQIDLIEKVFGDFYIAKADYLLIDDNKARLVAESLNINCIGTLGLLLKAKQKGLITDLKPIFEKLIVYGRFFSRKLLNDILIKIGESRID